MKYIISLFAKKFVHEEFEIIQKALVIAHNHYVSCGNFEDALKISNLLSENQDKDGCFIFDKFSANSFKFLSPEQIKVRIQHDVIQKKNGSLYLN